MKIKSLLIGMLACSAMVACTDDVLENGLEGQEAKKMDAYISLTINSNTNSSRSTGVGYGDYDGSAEHSGHEVNALDAENTVNKILVIVTPKTGTVKTDNTIDGFVKLLGQGQFKQTGTEINNIAPERVDYIQEYKTLVVINPVEGLLSELGYDEEENTFSKKHNEAYAAVCGYSGAGYVGTATKASNFMMANQTEVTVTPDVTNQTAETAAVAEIEVERVASKITFRPTLGTDENSGTDDNKYDILVKIKNYKAVADRKWYLKEYTETVGEGDAATTKTVQKYTYAYFNKAKQGEQVVWVLLTENTQFDGGQVDPDAVVGFFKDSGEDYTGYVTIEANEATGEEAFIGNKEADLLEEITDYTDKQTYLNTLTFEVTDITPSNQPTVNYSVKLEKYALTNMNTSVYAVRHKSNGTTTTTLSKLGTGDYIVVPYAANVNNWASVTTSAFETATLYETVKTQADDYTIDTWQSLPTSVGFESDGNAQDNTDILNPETSHDGLDVGYRLRYCYENAVPVAQTADKFISGIVFAGQVYDENGEAIPQLYKYNGNFYRTLKDLLVKNQGLNISENADANAIKTAKIEIYEEGKCYYYVPIKHKDNDIVDYSYANNVKTYDTKNGGVGVMEYAIMRNNVYSLKVTGISEIGSSTLDLTAASNVQDQSAFISVECTIKPWIVRFNDIKF